jgi:hypothetical protein
MLGFALQEASAADAATAATGSRDVCVAGVVLKPPGGRSSPASNWACERRGNVWKEEAGRFSASLGSMDAAEAAEAASKRTSDFMVGVGETRVGEREREVKRNLLEGYQLLFQASEVKSSPSFPCAPQNPC